MKKFIADVTYRFGKVNTKVAGLAIKNPRFVNTVKQFTATGAELKRVGVRTIEEFSVVNPFQYAVGTVISIYAVNENGPIPELNYFGETTIKKPLTQHSSESGLSDAPAMPVQFTESEGERSANVSRVAGAFSQQHARTLESFEKQMEMFLQTQNESIGAMQNIFGQTAEQMRNTYESQIELLQQQLQEKEEQLIELRKELAKANQEAFLQRREAELQKSLRNQEQALERKYLKMQEEEMAKAKKDAEQGNGLGDFSGTIDAFANLLKTLRSEPASTQPPPPRYALSDAQKATVSTTPKLAEVATPPPNVQKVSIPAKPVNSIVPEPTATQSTIAGVSISMNDFNKQLQRRENGNG